jgi:hypothetical protein
MGRVSVRIRIGNEWGVAGTTWRVSNAVPPTKGTTNRKEVGA